MREYQELCARIITEGTWVRNERTGKRCLTLINADMAYDVSDGTLPVLTTKKVNWQAAIAEFLGYLKGYFSAKQFRRLGCNTWSANANENAAWLANPYRMGTDDMGRCYGLQGRGWRNPEGEEIDQLANVYEDLKQGIDNRSEIISFWNVGERDRACLNACMHTHTFSLLNGVLYLTSYQRSDDIPLGHAFNQIQCGMFLLLMAHITGNKAGRVFHKIVNVHIYEDQLDILVSEQLSREPRPLPKLVISPEITTLKQVTEDMDLSHFDLIGYDPHPAIKFPFSV